MGNDMRIAPRFPAAIAVESNAIPVWQTASVGTVALKALSRRVFIQRGSHERDDRLRKVQQCRNSRNCNGLRRRQRNE